MIIKIIQIGKNKDQYITEATEEFLKRLRSFAKVEIIVLREFSASKTFTKEHCVEEEGQQILKTLRSLNKNGDCLIVPLDEKGKEYTSVEFSGFLRQSRDNGRTVVFIVGGAYGLAEEIKKSGKPLGLSKMTFTHQLVRVFLLEQIYRGFCILNGKEYHH